MHTHFIQWDSDGQPVFPEVEFQLYTPEGNTTFTTQPITNGFKFLGIDVDLADRDKAFDSVQQKFAEVEPHIQDSRLPPRLRLKMMVYTPMGKWRYIAGLVAEGHTQSVRRAAHFDADMKTALQLTRSCSKAALHATHDAFGLGLPDMLEIQHQKRLTTAMSLANCKVERVRAFFHMYLCFEAKMSGIKTTPGTEGPFFNWDVEALSSQQLLRIRRKSDLALLCAELKTRKLMITRQSATDLRRYPLGWAWALVPHYTSDLAYFGPAVDPHKAKDLMQRYADAEWATELRELNSQGALARVQGVSPALSNAWRKPRACGEKYWRWAARASLDLLPTALHLHRYGKSPTPICPACGLEVGNLAHILSRCPRLSSAAYTWRHDQVLRVLKKEVLRAGWHIISEGTDVPSQLLPRALVHQIHHRRPDLVAVNAATSTHLKIIVVELQINFERDDSMIRARQGKADRYTELMAALRAAPSTKVVQPYFVPVIIGARGSVMACASQDLTPLQLAAAAINPMLRAMSVQAIQGSQWLWSLWAQIAFR